MVVLLQKKQRQKAMKTSNQKKIEQAKKQLEKALKLVEQVRGTEQFNPMLEQLFQHVSNASDQSNQF